MTGEKNKSAPDQDAFIQKFIMKCLSLSHSLQLPLLFHPLIPSRNRRLTYHSLLALIFYYVSGLQLKHLNCPLLISIIKLHDILSLAYT